MKDGIRLSGWTLVVLVVVAGLSVGGWVLVRHQVDNQNKALLENDESQVVLLLQSALQNLQTQLRSVAYFTAASRNSPEVFAQQARSIVTGPTQSVALIDKSSPTPQVVLAKGKDLHAAQPLPAPLASVAARASADLSSSLVHIGGTTLVALAAATPVDPNLVALETSVINPHRATPNRRGPYRNIYINLYGTPAPGPDQLLLTTFGPGPLPQPVAASVLKLGSIRWLVEAAQRTPLSGTLAEASPWLALGAGLVLALLLVLLVETLARRERHAARLVAERTTDLLEAQKTLVRNERLTAVGELAAVVGHELRNPLGAATNNLFLLRHSLGDPVSGEVEEFLSETERQVNRAARLSEDLTAYMREREPSLVSLDFEELVADVLDATPPPPGVEVLVEDSVRFAGDAPLMTQVMTNLITNAYQAMPLGGSVRLAAFHEDHAVRITVQDGGDGFTSEVADRLFDPFFTTKDDGTGLGLAIVRRLVELHHGTVNIENVDGGGATVSIRLPDEASTPR
jgi:signal transduction histidine kinase